MHRLKMWLIRWKIALIYLYWRVKFLWRPAAMPRNADGKVYLNLGCGVNTSGEFVNVDAIPFAHTHIVANIQDLSMFPTGTVDMIYASHVIEHLPRNNLRATIKEWARLLKPGGVLRFGVPDFDKLVEMYTKSGRDTESIVNQLLGQDGEYDDHHTIWNRKYAEKVLNEAGLHDVRTWDPETAEHHAFQDKTNRAYTFGDEKIPLSLNLEATKA